MLITCVSGFTPNPCRFLLVAGSKVVLPLPADISSKAAGAPELVTLLNHFNSPYIRTPIKKSIVDR